MDKEGFNIIDAQYQKELETHRQRITEELTVAHNRKIYTGTRAMNEEHRKKEAERLQQEIAAAVNQVAQQLGALHFPDYGSREAALEAAEREEERQRNIQEVREQLDRNRNNQAQERGR